MRTLQRHWLSTATSVVLLLVAMGVLWQSLRRPTAQAMPDPYAALTRVQHDAITNLLAEVALDRDAQVALNPSANLAESILSTARTWWTNNAASLATLRETTAQKEAALRQLQQQIALGPAEEGQDAALAQAVSDLSTARTNYRNALAPLESSINELLSAPQRTTWASIKTGWGQQMPLRMLSLADNQRVELAKIERRYRNRRKRTAKHIFNLNPRRRIMLS